MSCATAIRREQTRICLSAIVSGLFDFRFSVVSHQGAARRENPPSSLVLEQQRSLELRGLGFFCMLGLKRCSRVCLLSIRLHVADFRLSVVSY